MGKPDPCICQVCGHNMGRSRCRIIDGIYGVRCNKCKTVYTVTLKFPSSHSPAAESESHEQAQDQSREGAG